MGWADRSLAPLVPFTILGGYLGAGKTTFLNRLIASPTLDGGHLVVLVNDVGRLNVDAALIAEHSGPTFTLTNGCVCCAITDDLGSTLEIVRALPDRPDRVVLETSGVADPGRLVPWAGTPGFRLDGVIVMADVEAVEGLVGRRYVGETVATQLRAADLVLLSKTDLVDDHQVDEDLDAVRLVRSLVGDGVPVLKSSDVGPSIVLGGRTVAPPSGSPSGSLSGSLSWHGPAHVRTDVVQLAAPTRAELQRLVDGFDHCVVRAKGIVRCVSYGSDPGGAVEVQVVGRRRTIRPFDGEVPEHLADRIVVISVDD